MAAPGGVHQVTYEEVITIDGSFEEFVRGHIGALLRQASVLTGERHAAEDLVQDTLISELIARAPATVRSLYVYDAHVLYEVGNVVYDSYGKLYVSHDAGRRWTPAVVPPNEHSFTVLGSDGHWTYAVGYGVANQPGHYYASLNGIDWQQIRTSLNVEDPDSVMVVPSAGLFAYLDTSTWHTTGTAPFTRVQDTTRTRSVVGCGPVAVGLRITPDGTITIATTTDGLHWKNGTIH